MILIVIFLIIIIKYIIPTEVFDLMCPYKCKKFGKECFEGNSKYFSSGKYKDKDTPDIILNKISYLADYNNRIVKWRRAFVVSFVASLIICFLVTSFSNKSFLIVFLTIFMLINGMFSFYQFHLEVFPSGYIKENVIALKNSLNIQSQEIPNKDIQDTLKVISGVDIVKTLSIDDDTKFAFGSKKVIEEKVEEKVEEKETLGPQSGPSPGKVLLNTVSS